MKSQSDGNSLEKSIKSSVLSEIDRLVGLGEIDDDAVAALTEDLDMLFVPGLSKDEVEDRLSLFMDLHPEMFDTLAMLDLDI